MTLGHPQNEADEILKKGPDKAKEMDPLLQTMKLCFATDWYLDALLNLRKETASTRSSTQTKLVNMSVKKASGLCLSGVRGNYWARRCRHFIHI